MKSISEFTGLLPVKEVSLAEEEDKEGEIMSTILTRKVSDFKQTSLLSGKDRESTRQFRMRPLGYVTNSDQSAHSNVPEADLPKTGFARTSAPNLDKFESIRSVEALVPEIQKKDFDILMSNTDVKNEVLQQSEELATIWITAYLEEIDRIEHFFL